ncbi:MAG: cupredoxin domain-containing protein, partial [Actinomycetota bacterium]|nr:cupredoxin domain-containing protein [Actinomycetota bacterium]
ALQTPLSRARPVYTRVTVFGLLTVAVGLLVLLAASGYTGLPLLPFIVVPLVVAALAWRFGTWAKILAAVIGLVLLVLGVQLGFLLPAFAHPDVFFEFMPAIAYLTGAAMAAAGGVTASWKRRDLRPDAARGERWVLTVTLAALILLGIVSAVASLASRTTVDMTNRAGAIAVTQRDLAFAPANYEVTARENANFVVHNSDPVFHTFTVPELGIDADVKPGSDVVVELDAPDPGVYTIICKPHASRLGDGTYEGMTATLTVR